MADNLNFEAVVTASSEKLVLAETTFGGDTAYASGSFLGILTGAEGSRVFTQYVAGAGVVDGGTQRITLASDDPAVTALQIIDDWDESDRAKVNLIVGQAGIAAGAGAVGATVPRMTLASDDPAVVSLAALDDLVKTEDAAHSTGDKGVMSLAVRSDSLLGTTSADGDYAPLFVDQDNRLYVRSAAKYNATPPSLLDGNVADLQLDSSGRLHVAAAQNGTWTVTGAGGSFPVTDSGGSLTVDGTVAFSNTTIAVTNAGTFATQAVCTNAGTFVVQENGAALTALQLIDDTVYTDDAAFTPGTSKVLAIGAQADEDTTDSVDEGDVGALRMTLERKLRTVAALDSAAMQSGNDQVTPKFAAIAASTSGDNTIVAAVASKKIRVAPPRRPRPG